MENAQRNLLRIFPTMLAFILSDILTTAVLQARGVRPEVVSLASHGVSMFVLCMGMSFLPLHRDRRTQSISAAIVWGLAATAGALCLGLVIRFFFHR